MKTPNKHTMLALLLLAVCVSLTLPCTYAQAAPSVPQFTLNIIDNSQVKPTTYTADPYTGETTANFGYTLENITVQLKVINQPFTPSVLADGNTTELRYMARFKGHFTDWSSSKNGTATQTGGAETVFTHFKGWGHHHYESWQILPDVQGAQVDFQVKAQVGYHYTYYDDNGYPYPFTVFVVLSESDWSSAQTLGIPSGQGQNVDAQPTQSAPITNPPEAPTAMPEQNAVVSPGQPEASFYLDSEDLTTALQVTLLVVVLCVIAGLAVVFIRSSNKAASLSPPPP